MTMKMENCNINNINNTKTNNNKKEKWIIDTDPGCDDLFAILYMLQRTDVEIVLISVAAGNAKMEDVINNIKRCYSIFNKPYPLTCKGVSEISDSALNAYDYHFEGGLGDIEEINNLDMSSFIIDQTRSPEKIIELVKAYPGEINLLAIAPMTNISIAYMLDNEIAGLLKSTFIMGGSLKSRGNILQSSEFNFAYDSLSTQIVLRNFNNTVIVPWDPTENIGITPERFQKMRENIEKRGEKVDERIYYYLGLIITKFFERSKEKLQICDLYTIMARFNHKVANKFIICKSNVVIDSDYCKGTLVNYLVENKYSSFTEALNDINNLPEDCKIIVTRLNEDEIMKEFEVILTEVSN